MITQKPFAKTLDGRQVTAYTLHDGEAYATVLDFGGTLQSLVVPDKKGRLTDVVLGYPDVTRYERNSGYLGALIGRYGNRIAEGHVNIEGKTYELYCNDRGNHLHGGKTGFNRKFWNAEVRGDELVLTLLSPDGEEFYPGNLQVEVIYTFQNRELKIRYRAVTDKTTVVNLTNHAYFNMNGESNGSILDNYLCINSKIVIPTNETMIPTGGFRGVAGTPFDFTQPKEIGRDIEMYDIDLENGNGYDHCFVLDKKLGEYGLCAVAESRRSGIRMTCFTDAPCVQFYAGNGLHQEGKHNYYGKRAGFCLETEMIPNNVNSREYSVYGSSYLRPGEVYSYTAAYRFDTIG